MKDINKVRLVGSVSSKPETFKMSNGDLLVKFKICTIASYKDEHGNTQSVKSWHQAICYNELATKAVDEIKELKTRIDASGSLKYSRYRGNLVVQVKLDKYKLI